jgi:hypothetical protein
LKIERKYLLAFPIFLALILTTAITLLYGRSIGVDINYHIDVAEQYATGNFSGVLNLDLKFNNGFYPPLLQVVLVPSCWLGISYQFSGLLQILFLPLAVATFGFLVYKTYGLEAGLLGEFLVLGSWAYIDRVLAVQPQSIDCIILPLAYYFFLNVKQNKLLITCILGFYNHSLLSLATLSGVLLKQLKQKKWVAAYTICIAPLLAVTIYYLVTAKGFVNQFGVGQGFWSDPLFLLTYVRLPTIGLGIAIYLSYLLLKKQYVHPLSKLCILSLITSAILIPFAVDRYFQFATIPLTLLIVDGYLRIKDKLAKAWFFMATIGFMILLYAVLWFLTFTGSWQTIS